MTTVMKSVCRVLVAAMMLLPVHAVRADMIAVERALAAPSAHQAALGRLQAMGISSNIARERVAAMTDEEAAGLARELESLPAGGAGSAAFAFLGVLLLFAFAIFHWGWADRAPAR